MWHSSAVHASMYCSDVATEDTLTATDDLQDGHQAGQGLVFRQK